MNNYHSFFIYLLISLAFIFLQSSLAPHLELYTPDLNLILIIYLASTRNIQGDFYLTILNGLLMDVFSGNTTGLYTLTRLATYIALKGSSEKFDLNNFTGKIMAIFFGTILFWVLFKFVTHFAPVENLAKIPLKLIIGQATINIVVGIVITPLLNKINAKL